MGRLSELLALEMGISPAAARRIRAAAALHDIGKLKIPESILNKPGKLDSHEFEIIKTHTKLGVEMLASIQGELGDMVRIISLFHHEWHKPDIGGYWGVSTYYLPDYVSITGICDVFTALVARRPYKDAWPPEEAIAYIRRQTGTQFSEELVEVFIPLIRNDRRVAVIFEGIQESKKSNTKNKEARE